MNDYTVTLIIDLSADSPEEAAEDFATYVRDNAYYTVVVSGEGLIDRVVEVCR
jgi:hypothetical protein